MPSFSLARFLRFLPLAALGVALARPGSAEAEAPRIEAPLLWQVDGGQRPSFFFGTIHAGVDASELPPVVDAALQHSEVFVMETPPPRGLPARAIAAALPMDLALADRAHRTGKRIGALESLQFQLSLLSQVGGGQDLAAVLSEDPAAIEGLIAAYRSGDLEQVGALAHTGDAEMQELLLDRRNRHWDHRLAPGLRRGGLFVAVGAGHLPGEQGLLELVRQRGYSTRQLGQS